VFTREDGAASSERTHPWELDSDATLLSLGSLPLVAPLFCPRDGSVAIDWIEFPDDIDEPGGLSRSAR